MPLKLFKFYISVFYENKTEFNFYLNFEEIIGEINFISKVLFNIYDLDNVFKIIIQQLDVEPENFLNFLINKNFTYYFDEHEIQYQNTKLWKNLKDYIFLKQQNLLL